MKIVYTYYLAIIWIVGIVVSILGLLLSLVYERAYQRGWRRGFERAQMFFMRLEENGRQVVPPPSGVVGSNGYEAPPIVLRDPAQEKTEVRIR